MAPLLEHQHWLQKPFNNVELKTLAKAVGLKIGRSTQHYTTEMPHEFFDHTAFA